MLAFALGLRTVLDMIGLTVFVCCGLARLARFNAEILGHHNPAQRILYVDRVRRELAAAKQVRFRRLAYLCNF